MSYLNNNYNLDYECHHQWTKSNTKLNLSILADKIVGKLSLLVDGRRKGRNDETTMMMMKKKNENDHFWQFIKQMISILMLIIFFMIIFNVNHRHRHHFSNNNGSILVGLSYHKTGHSYFYWNQCESFNITNVVVVGRISSSSSSSLPSSRMDDRQFTRYLFDHVQLWID